MQGLLRSGIGMVALVSALGAQAISVGSGGQASYGLPLSVPPGVSGMAPNLALSYADGGINGPVGMGWSLQGISTITRCPSSKLTDGVDSTAARSKVLTGNSRYSVRFDGHDRLCLDGQRLIAVDPDTGNPLASSDTDAMGLDAGVPYREFRTEKDSFARIRAYGMAVAGTPHAGPAYFKVWTKSGQIYEYGTDPSGSVAANARINAQGTNKVAVWAASRISDSVGNYMDFKYQVRSLPWGSGTTTAGSVGQEWNLVEVQYTGNTAAGLTPRNKVIFVYADRPDNSAAEPADRSEAYQGTSKNISVQRLAAVRTYINSDNPTVLGKGAAAVLVRSWALSYNRLSSGRSRLDSVKECVDEAHTQCLPATSFEYSNGASPLQYTGIQGFANSPLVGQPLIHPEGWISNLTGDFNGDGKTDVMVLYDNVVDTGLYFSRGNGEFSAKVKSPALNNISIPLYKKDGCYSSQAMDFNGDGKTDILTIKKASCNGNVSAGWIHLSTGDGSFITTVVNSAIDFEYKELSINTVNIRGECYDSSGELIDGTFICARKSYSNAQRQYFADINGDGLIDIITTRFPGFVWNTAWTDTFDPNSRCSSPGAFFTGETGVLQCSRFFINNGAGNFTEYINHPQSSEVLFANLPKTKPGLNPYWSRVALGDIDGDGLVDIRNEFYQAWRNRGDGTFEPGVVGNTLCSLPIDFNGDQRSDCLRADSNAGLQQLRVDGGAGVVARFNLNTVGNELYGEDTNTKQQITGVIVEDLNGDGRQDLLRWSQNTGLNGIYLSNGDGSFRSLQSASLNVVAEPLSTTDGSRSFITGDFMGNGSLQILMLRSDAAPGGSITVRGVTFPFSAKPNVLLALSGDRGPIDQLVSVRTGNGVVFKVDRREPLTTSSAYVSDVGTANAAPPVFGTAAAQLDITLPSYVITSTTKSSPGFADVTTLYSYHGLKAERNGRGMLGYRETRQQSKAPDGSDLTVVTKNLLSHPYVGVAAVTETYRGPLSLSGAQRLSRTTYSYCDKTSTSAPTDIATGGTAPAPCATSAKIQRPYVYQSLEEGWELDKPSIVLPSVKTTNSYNDWGDPLTIKVDTTGTALGLSQTFTKTVNNVYATPVTSGDAWILGRLSSATVTQSAPNSLPSIATVAGTNPRATQRDGAGTNPVVPPPPATINPAVLSAILSILLDE